MNKFSTLAIIAALVAAPAIANAQDVTAGVSTAVSGAVSSGGVSAAADASLAAGVTAPPADGLTVDTLLGDLAGTDLTADVTAVTGATAESTINIVEVGSLEGNTETTAQAVADAKTNNSARMDSLHAAIAANAAIQAKLTAAGHDTDDVVAVKVDAQGAFWVYVDEAE